MKIKTTNLSTLTAGSIRLWRLWVATLACGLATQLGAATTTIYSNDFESYTNVATSLADTSDADPTGVEWNIVDDVALDSTPEGAGVQVINWLTNAAGQPTKSLLLRPSSEAQIYLRNAKSGTRYQLDFWVYSAREAASDRGFYILLRGEGNDYNGHDYIAYRSDRAANSTKLFLYDGVKSSPGWLNIGASHLNYVWQHHRLVIDPNTQWVSVYVDDMVTPVTTVGRVARSEVAVPTLVRIVNEANSANDNWWALDDFSLTVEDAPSLATTFTEGFESYSARVNAADDADPAGPWITTETDGVADGGGRPAAPGKVQVVDSSVVAPHSGSKSLKLEGGQRAGVSLAWGETPQRDVQITWWARVPQAVQSSPTADAVYLRMSLYGVEGANSFAGDCALLGYGIRRQNNTNVGDGLKLLYYNNSAWQETPVSYTPDVWEEYRLITHTGAGKYTIIKSPSSANPEVVVDREPFISSTLAVGPIFMAGWSSSNGTNHPPVYVDDIQVKSLVADAEPLGIPYTVTNYGTRFTNWTVLNVNAPVGRPIVDPRDNTTILYAVDADPLSGGGIYRAQKVAAGNWVLDPTPIVSGLDRPSGLAIEANGTLWWTHDYNNNYTRSVARLKWPWANNSVETIIADVGDDITETDDDAIDLVVAPSGFNGSIGQPGWIVVADRGVDGNAYNGVYVIDPATTLLSQTNYNNWLVSPTASDLGGDLTAITAVGTSEVATLSVDGYLVAIDADGNKRYINAWNLWPASGPNAGQAIAQDPITGRIWAADDLKDELWSIDSTTGDDVREVGFPLFDPQRPDRQIRFHDPGMAFAPNGSFLVVSDGSLATGGRLIILHNEAFSVPNFAITSVAPTALGCQLKWGSAGAARYNVQRSLDVANAGSFQNIATNLTTLEFIDTNAPAAAAFYRIVATPAPVQ